VATCEISIAATIAAATTSKPTLTAGATTGKKPDRDGGCDVARRDLAQKIAYIEEACRSVLSIINEIERVKPDEPETVPKLVSQLRSEFRFLDTLQDARGLWATALAGARHLPCRAARATPGFQSAACAVKLRA
jgi:hypothetical protein